MNLPNGFAEVGSEMRADEALYYEYVDEEPKRRRDPEPKTLPRHIRSLPVSDYWDPIEDREAPLTKTHINRRFDDLQRTVCGAVGVLHEEVTALKSVFTSATNTAETPISHDNIAQRIADLAAGQAEAGSAQLREMFDLIAEYEIIPAEDVSNAAFEALANPEGRLRAAAANALGVLRPAGAMVKLAAAFDAEMNRHIKKIIGQSLKAIVQ